jgi:deferrochelatase/peroxidase EfeB
VSGRGTWRGAADGPTGRPADGASAHAPDGPSAQAGAAPEDPPRAAPGRSPAVGRRGLLGAAGAALVAGGGLGVLGGRATAPGSGADAQGAEDPLSTAHPVRGEHQQGIVTPAQDYLVVAAFDLTAGDLDALRSLMSRWLVASEQMAAGELVGGLPLANPQAAPLDTGEAWGYPPSALTVTVGLGRGVFLTEEGEDRLGLADRIPDVLAEGIPRFGNEALKERASGGDLLVQACANDAQVALHAIRNLTRLAQGTAALRWTQIGYGRTSSTSVDQETPRNLFGFKDGTANLKAEEGAEELGEHLWVAPEDPAGDWLSGGTYLAFRKIRMRLETWDRLRLVEQQEIIGRDKRHGAPLSVVEPTAAAQEFETPDYTAGGADAPLIPRDAHIRVVAPEHNGGARMLRRGYNFTDGSDALGQFDAGLFFIAFVRDPRTGLYPALSRMTREDALVEYLQHVATGVYAILPGPGAEETMFAQRLLGTEGAPGG